MKNLKNIIFIAILILVCIINVNALTITDASDKLNMEFEEAYLFIDEAEANNCSYEKSENEDSETLYCVECDMENVAENLVLSLIEANPNAMISNGNSCFKLDRVFLGKGFNYDDFDDALSIIIGTTDPCRTKLEVVKILEIERKNKEEDTWKLWLSLIAGFLIGFGLSRILIKRKK